MQTVPVADSDTNSSATPSQEALPDAYREMVRSFGEVAAALSDQGDLDSLLHLIAERICALTGVPRCSVYLREEGTDQFKGQVGHADHDIDALVKRLVAGCEADRFTKEILETKRPVVVANALDDPRPIRSTMRAWNVRSMLGVPMVLRGDVIGIVFLDVEHEHWVFTDSAIQLAATFADLAAVAIAQARLTGDLRHSLSTVARQNKLLRRAAAVDERLGALSLQGASFAEIGQAVADLTAKPCAIYDSSYRALATAKPSWLDEPEPLRFPDDGAWVHPDVSAAVTAASQSGSGLLPRMPQAGLNYRFLVAPVMWREHQWGVLAIMEYGTQFAALDRHIARRAATSIALELSAEHRAAQSESDARASLLTQLIAGGNQDVPALEHRAQYLGVQLEQPRVLCLATCAGDGQLPAAADLVNAIAHGSEVQVLASAVADGILIAFDLEPGHAVREAIEDVRAKVEAGLQRAESGSRLVAAMSASCASLVDFPRAYREAQQVLACLTTVADLGRTRTLTADDLGPARLLLASTNRHDAQRFSQNALGVLLSEDVGMVDLLETLYVFFDCSRSVRRSAQVLALHENTIRYRLARVEELTGLAVASSSDDQLTVQFALLILRICGDGASRGWPVHSAGDRSPLRAVPDHAEPAAEPRQLTAAS
jgi:sugar diacid utilization regulator